MPSSDPLVGQTISHYRIIEKLGGGGMGVEDVKLELLVITPVLDIYLRNLVSQLPRLAVIKPV